ncbi:glycoside hydrolase family 2 protein [Marilutibacter chinensis]|uniref:Beta galactosidase jelly roll domain-containing protein n=1 Tax=Marilutibacter chinensis TaxID=2912247 RepID=A0ABS9HRG5_9GAMM|nr:beta galactosidase jelly roll domain-containing protein [Lysobacter chinensis]
MRPLLRALRLFPAILVLAVPVGAGAQDGYRPLPADEAAAGNAALVEPAEPGDLPSLIANVAGRSTRSLDGRWQAMVDAYGAGMGDWKAAWRDRVPERRDEFLEYGFDDAFTLQVPGDFNTQQPELHWLEGSVWYRRQFDFDAARLRKQGRRVFVHFGAANYRADVFLNGEPVGSHEGGFTPFQFELTGKLKQGANRLLVHVDNRRRRDSVPAMGFDWFNYGGLTRSVRLVEVPAQHVHDYHLQLAPGGGQEIRGWVRLEPAQAGLPVKVELPELGVSFPARTDANGRAEVAFSAPLQAWSPERPKLYRVRVSGAGDTVEDEIGFRSIVVQGDRILLNGEPLRLLGVNLHEEIDGRRAASDDDYRRLLERVKALGANFARTSHYPFGEGFARLADRMGILLWEEIPVYQGIDFEDPGTRKRMQQMLAEMIGRDRNRAAVIMWGIANETAPGDARNAVLSALAAQARATDPTRLIAAAFYGPGFHGARLEMHDPLFQALDVIGANIYYGWYVPWPVAPEEVEWISPGKPLLISEFGAGARHGRHGPADLASDWNEEFQAEFYRKQFRMIERLPFVQGTLPWVLSDFRSPVRMHPYQQGFNRKGLLSESGERKLAWEVVADAYRSDSTAPRPDPDGASP